RSIRAARFYLFKEQLKISLTGVFPTGFRRWRRSPSIWNGAVSSTRRMFTNGAMNFEGNLTLRKPARRSNGLRAIPLPASSSRPNHPITSRLVGGVRPRAQRRGITTPRSNSWRGHVECEMLPCVSALRGVVGSYALRKALELQRATLRLRPTLRLPVDEPWEFASD